MTVNVIVWQLWPVKVKTQDANHKLLVQQLYKAKWCYEYNIWYEVTSNLNTKRQQTAKITRNAPSLPFIVDKL